MKALKRFLPKSLLGRAVLIIVMPLVLLQIVATAIFFETHWDTITRRLANGVAGDVAVIVQHLRTYAGPENHRWIVRRARESMELEVKFEEGAILENRHVEDQGGMMEQALAKSLRERVRRPFVMDTDATDRQLLIRIQLSDGVLNVMAPRKRLFSSTTYVFVIWMVGTSLILFAVAMIFMRNQVRPIRRLAVAAKAFGVDREVPRFKPEGATEVREAAIAFMEMRDRIKRHVQQRTDMLSGVSHDLRTPLTRMKLEVAMLGDGDASQALNEDILEMEHMIEGYLAFARGEGREEPVMTDLRELLADVAARNQRSGSGIDLHVEGDIRLPLKRVAFRRAVTNLVANALRYADHVSLRAGQRRQSVEITVDDDGPGIPDDQLAEVFKPFVRLDQSRNPETGGVGLGLTITRDIVRGHGGDIELSRSPQGGLRARIRLPLLAEQP
jgi:two-component system osmolarity sensor histidine kinase EnvZ